MGFVWFLWGDSQGKSKPIKRRVNVFNAASKRLVLTDTDWYWLVLTGTDWY